MLLMSIIFFSLAAFLGLFLLTYVLQNKNTPKAIAFTHGPLAAIGLVILIIYACLHSPAPITAISIFVVAAIGGFFLIYRDLTGKVIPKGIAMLHGLLAIVGFAFLIYFALTH